MNNHISIATISSPEFINLEPLDINPLMSKCEIKVFYLGKNRNGSMITKDVATEMAKTLRGAPIVGYYRKDKEDFFDHGDRITMDGDGVHFETMTRPYGFVAPDARVWFQDFEEKQPDGSSIIRTYLMTTGFLWTGQYEEAKQILDDGGKPHSMEIDEKTLSGYWTKESNSFMEFFIINDAIFSKLCILGDEVEPCFEGSSITAPEVSANFTLDEKFTSTLFSMMKELQETLQGGKNTVDENQIQETVEQVETPEVEPVQEEAAAPAVEEPMVEAPEAEVPAAEFEKTEDNSVQVETEKSEVSIEETNSSSVEFEKKDDDKEKEDNSSDDNKEEDSEEEKVDDEDKKKYSLLQADYEDLQAKFSNLENEVKELRKFKASIENDQKDKLIAEFYMLSDEDKKDVIDNKASYSLDEIKSKLAVICYDKKINYSHEETEALADATVNINPVDTETPDWLAAVERHSNRK